MKNIEKKKDEWKIESNSSWKGRVNKEDMEKIIKLEAKIFCIKVWVSTQLIALKLNPTEEEKKELHEDLRYILRTVRELRGCKDVRRKD